ncbi:MAG: hypothetical protein MZV63_55420 [Marinilabiliales bacterium]|nr:hypothetical protein [Marinilabiliales bacterium]
MHPPGTSELQQLLRHTPHEEFHDALHKLLTKGMTKLILDLQGNVRRISPGGSRCGQ